MIKQWSKVKVGDKVFFWGRFREVQGQHISPEPDCVLFLLEEMLMVSRAKEDFVRYYDDVCDEEIKIGNTIYTQNGFEIVTWVGERQYGTSGGGIFPLTKEMHYA